MQRHVIGPEPLVVSVQRAQRVPLAGLELEQHMRLLGQAVEVAEEEQPEEVGSPQPQPPLHLDGGSPALASSSQEKALESDTPAHVTAVILDGFLPPQVQQLPRPLVGGGGQGALGSACCPLLVAPPASHLFSEPSLTPFPCFQACRRACSRYSPTRTVRWPRPGMITGPCLLSQARSEPATRLAA
jgi:hypothetical protein